MSELDKGLGASAKTVDVSGKVVFVEILSIGRPLRPNNGQKMPFVRSGSAVASRMFLTSITAVAFPERLVEVFLPKTNTGNAGYTRYY